MKKSIKLIFTSNLNKVLDSDVQFCKDMIRSSGGVVTGPVCFKQQRQLTYHNPTTKGLYILNSVKLHKSINVSVLTH